MNFKISKLLYISLLILGVLFTSCEDEWIDTGLNTDPDSPEDVPMSMLIPSIQANTAYNVCGADVAGYANIWLQQFNGHDRQMNIIAQYIITPSDVNNFWNSQYYVTMMDCKVLIDKALKAEVPSYKYAGIGQVMLAYNLAVQTDLFGDIPYSEAFLGTEVLQPIVDSQESVYGVIDNLLTEGISNLGKEEPLPIEGDMIFGGKSDIASAWIKTAYALKARNYLLLSDRNTSGKSDALNALGNAYTSNADNFKFAFGTASSEQHPITQFVDQRGDISMGKLFVDMLVNADDPRLPFFAGLSDEDTYAGGAPGSLGINGISPVGPYLNNKDASISGYFMTYAECKFIEAECLLGTNDEGALTAFKEGVKASIADVTGDANEDWIDTNIESITSITLEDIVVQKYIANFGQYQVYNDYRRTGYPVLEPVPGATKPQPVRFPYPQEEITYNDNIEALWQNTVFLNTKVWWDVD